MKRRFTELRIPAGGNETRPASILVVDGRIVDVSSPDELPGEADSWKTPGAILDQGTDACIAAGIDSSMRIGPAAGGRGVHSHSLGAVTTTPGGTGGLRRPDSARSG